MGHNRRPGNKSIIKENLKSTDRIAVVYNNVEHEMTVSDFERMARPYKKYVVNMTQSSTEAPTVVVLENELHDTLTWTYEAVGRYEAVLTGAFPADKVQVYVGNIGLAVTVSGVRVDANTVRIRTSQSGSASDGKLSNTPIEIRVYN